MARVHGRSARAAPRETPIVSAPSAIPSANSDPEPASALPSIDVSALPPSPRAQACSRARDSKVERSNGLDDELARVDRARSLLASGKPADALLVVNTYRREYRPEHSPTKPTRSKCVRWQPPQDGRAKRVLAERFLTKRPGSPYAEPVRAAVG